MVAEEFLNLVTQFKLTSYVGVEDFADKLSFLVSVVILTLAMMVVAVKSYFLNPLACYAPTVPEGLDFGKYLENYCWVEGTYFLSSNDRIPNDVDEWNKLDYKKLTYYQWVPFILGLQCIMFYVPRIIWQLICYNKIGTNLENLVTDANNATNDPPEERKGKVERIARTIEDMLFQHRDYRHGRIAKVRRKIYDVCNFCVFSKHMGTWLVLSYFFMKILYGLNAISQLFIMERFLGFNSSLSKFGYTILNNMVNGRESDQTGIFPRVTYCYVRNVSHAGVSNNYVGQCALPINMLNEKIYIFLWFWVLFVGIVTAISLPLWLFRLAFVSRRSKFVKKFLLMHESYDKSDKQLVDVFIKEFLRHDGLFLIRMIFINAGDIITADIVNRLWQIYKESYKNMDFRNFTRYMNRTDNGSAPELYPKLFFSDDSIMKEDSKNFV